MSFLSEKERYFDFGRRQRSGAWIAIVSLRLNGAAKPSKRPLWGRRLRPLIEETPASWGDKGHGEG
jgi:hypothetical protein